MWGLLETFILYCKKKKLTIPLLLSGIGAVIYLAISLANPSGKSFEVQRADPLPTHVQPREGGITPPASPPPQSRGAVRQQRYPEVIEPSPLPHTDPPTLQAEAISNGENIVNFTRFHEHLRVALMDHFGESFSRNLSARISDNLSQGETSMEVLEATIREELGAGATDEKIQEVRSHITQVLGKVAQGK